MSRCLLIVTVLGSLVLAASRATAVSPTASTYTNTVLGGIKNQNSVGAYSTQNISRSIYNSSVPRNAYSGLNRNLFSSAMSGSGTSAARPTKPFGAVNRGSGPTPWLALSDPFASTGHSYYTQVRPQLQQQAQGGRMANHAQQGASMSETPPYDPQGNDHMAPTGHTSTYMNYGGYYIPNRPTKAPARQ